MSDPYVLTKLCSFALPQVSHLQHVSAEAAKIFKMNDKFFIVIPYAGFAHEAYELDYIIFTGIRVDAIQNVIQVYLTTFPGLNHVDMRKYCEIALRRIPDNPTILFMVG